MTDDAELLLRYAQARSEAAFGELVRRHIDLVYSVALRQVGGDTHLAQDVVQVAFSALASRAADVSRRQVVVGWLYRTAQNAAIDCVRREQRRRDREMKAAFLNEPTESPDWENARPLLDRAICDLSETDRAAVLLRFFKGHSYGEVGQKLGLSENASRMRVERALDKLRDFLARQNITSSSAAIASSLAAQAGVAAPAGMATSVTGIAMAGAAGGLGLLSAFGILQTMSNTKAVGTAFLVLALVTSLTGNAYLLTQPIEANADSTNRVVARPAEHATAAEPEVNLQGLVESGDLTILRDRLRTQGASDESVRSILEGILRRRYREKLSEDRAARYGQGWWKDIQRTWGTAESSRRLTDDPVLLRTMVIEPLERLLGPDPIETAEIEAKYAFLPPEMRTAFGRVDRMMQGDGSPGGGLAPEEFIRISRIQIAEREPFLASLSPEQRQAYEMRFGMTGANLSRQLGLLDPTESEFKAVYPLADQYAKTARALESEELRQNIPPWTSRRRNELDRGYTQQLVDLLGYDRALDFIWSGTQEYPPYANVVREEGLPAGTAGRVIQLAAETAERGAAIHADPGTNLDQKNSALLALQHSARLEFDQLIPPGAQARLTPQALQWIEVLGNGRYKESWPALPGLGGFIGQPINALSTPPSRNRLPPVSPPRGQKR